MWPGYEWAVRAREKPRLHKPRWTPLSAVRGQAALMYTFHCEAERADGSFVAGPLAIKPRQRRRHQRGGVMRRAQMRRMVQSSPHVLTKWYFSQMFGVAAGTDMTV